MEIYIDESGIFRKPANRASLFSCVCALVMPSRQRDRVLAQFEEMKASWGTGSAEVKGNQLIETQAAAVISMLKEYELFALVVAIDMGAHSDDVVAAFKMKQAAMIVKDITSTHQPTMIEEAERLRRDVEGMPNQLFVEAFAIVLLIERLIHISAIYYGMRMPEELGEFRWRIDAKDVRITAMERIWTTMILPIMENMGMTRDILLVEGGDYSYLNRFEIREREAAGDMKHHIEWLKEEIDQARPEESHPAEEFCGIDLKKVMQEDFRSEDSKNDPGLQLVDIVASAITRALNGNLRQEGWGGIGALLLPQRPILGLEANRKQTATILRWS